MLLAKAATVPFPAAFLGHVNLFTLSLWVGAALPLLVAVLKQDGFSRKTNSIIAFVAAVVAGVITTAAKGGFHQADWVTAIIAVYTVASATYHSIWKPTGVDAKIKVLTSFKRVPAPKPAKAKKI